MDPQSEHSSGLLASLKRIGRATLSIAENRIELFLVELQEERVRFFGALLLVMLAGVLGLMALVVGTLAVVVLCGEDHRLAVLAVLSLLYFLAALAVIGKLRALLRNWTAFADTMAEFRKDKHGWTKSTRTVSPPKAGLDP
jgi:uncharacterized membrane protein YqjE